MTTKTFTTPQERTTLLRYAEARAALEKAKDAETAARKALLELAGDTEEVKADGVRVFTAREVVSQRFDVKAFQVDNPEAYEAYLVESVARPLRWSGLPAGFRA